MKKIILLVSLIVSVSFSNSCIGYTYESNTIENVQIPKVIIQSPTTLPDSGSVTLSANKDMDSRATPYFRWCINIGTLYSNDTNFQNVQWILPLGWEEQVYKAKVYLVAGDSLGYEAYAKKEFKGEVDLDPHAPSVQFTPLYSPSENKFKLSFQANAYTTKVIFLSSYDNLNWVQIDATTSKNGIRGKILPDAKDYRFIYFKARAYAGSTYKETKVQRLAYEPIVGQPGDKNTELPTKAVLKTVRDISTQNYVDVAWYMVKDSYGEDNAVSYEIEYADNSNFSNATRKNAGHNRVYMLQNLQDETRYYIRVRAVNYKGNGTWSNAKSIYIDLENDPVLDTSYQYPANTAVGISKTPVFAWHQATDKDGDTVEYRVEFGESRDRLNYKSDWTEDITFDLATEFDNPLKPNILYYWHIIYREKGQGIDHYGGAYPSSPIWSFKTVSTGPDLTITNVRMIDNLEVDKWLRFEITVKNIGSELAKDQWIEPYMIKNNQQYKFKALKNSHMNRDLLAGETDKVVLSLQFTNSLEEYNGETYNNILEDGNNVVRFELDRRHNTHDADFTNNSKDTIVTYSLADNLPEVSIDLNSNVASDRTGTPTWNLGYSIRPRMIAEDNLEVTKITLEYRVNLDDDWHMIDTYVNNKIDYRDNFNVNIYHNDVLWRAQGDEFITDKMQLRAKAYNSDTTYSSVLSEQFVVYSDEQLNLSNFRFNKTHIQKSNSLTFSWDSDGTARSLYVIYVRPEGTTTWKKLFVARGETQKEIVFDYDIGRYEFQLVSSYPAYTVSTQKLTVEAEPKKPVAPTIENTLFDIQNNVPTITLTCNGVYDSCKIYKGYQGHFIELQTVVSSSEIVTDLAIEYGLTYEYKAVATKDGLESDFGSSVNILASYSEEYEVIIENEDAQFITANSVHLLFKPSKVLKYENYEIHVGTEINNLPLYTYTNSREVTLSTLEYATPYYVEIYPLDYNNNRVSTLPAKLAFTTGFDTRIITDKPQVSIGDFTAESVILSWASIDNADEYIILRSENSGSYESVGITTDTEFIDTITFAEGAKYKYIVKAKNSTGSTISDETNEITPNVINDTRPSIDVFTLLNADECFVDNTCDFKINASKGDNDLATYAIHFEANPQRFECGSVSTYGTAEHTAPEGGPFATEEVTILPTISTRTHTDIFECHDIARLQVCDSKDLCSEKVVNLPTNRTDSDNDGHYDGEDAFPNNPNEWLDTDGDGIGNNADLDDDGDGMSDVDEIKYWFDPLDPSDANEDADADGVSNIDEINSGGSPIDGALTLKANEPISGTLELEEWDSYKFDTKDYKKITFRLDNFNGTFGFYFDAITTCYVWNFKEKECIVEPDSREIIDIGVYSSSSDAVGNYTIEAIVEEAKNKWVPIMMGDILMHIPYK